MKKIFLLVFSISILIFESSANGIDFIEGRTWKEVLAKAKRENKLIFLDAYASWCGPCKYLQKNVFTDSEVGKFFNAKFINVKMDMEEGEGIEIAEMYKVTSYPTLFFINGEGKLVHKSVGAMEADKFLVLGKNAIDPQKQYFPLKEKAKQGRLSSSAFHSWVHEAERMEDEDLPAIIRSYIEDASGPLMETNMLELIMDHAELSGKEQMDLLYKNRVEAASLIGISVDEFNTKLKEKIVAFGNKHLQEDKIKINQFTSLLDAYYPEHSKLETKLARISYFKNKEMGEKCLTEVKELISDASSYKLGVQEMSNAILDAVIMIAENKRGAEFISLVKSYRLKGEDVKMEYYKDFALALLYYSEADMDNLEIHVKKLVDNDDTPEALIDFIAELLEE